MFQRTSRTRLIAAAFARQLGLALGREPAGRDDARAGDDRIVRAHASVAPHGVRERAEA